MFKGFVEHVFTVAEGEVCNGLGEEDALVIPGSSAEEHFVEAAKFPDGTLSAAAWATEGRTFFGTSEGLRRVVEFGGVLEVADAVAVCLEAVWWEADPGVVHVERVEEFFADVLAERSAVDALEDFGQDEPTCGFVVSGFFSRSPVDFQRCLEDVGDDFFPGRSVQVHF